MITWSFLFLLVAVAAGIFGFLGIAGTAAGIAKMLFIAFLILFVASFFTGRKGRT
ncbi:DUF1328 domain-containing protein [Paenibacillus mucilaginosus]|uniref:Uncharacterized protein n=3 Tax=Paenibacillus mucilaginosus TaxID=61624 RepID=H6NKD8_9BACL|nr:DUF1328 domain-containing protein [Paenibacillus mucilaginosus]AEI42729.1 hypothetical protein KNP414_04197 [Paenibacillus mucilaginosus KNP414]AFC32329.1 hypothetical protein PM3016_5637 [Paenibacillus mucilaginosus 3016]AFH64635.1 membrane protein [Paenibacillus mucilaginosus K02]MCG7217028.1 DUF1328 domain-containing protein [Paenibacillus mucilaginosus]WDM26107.1 DUF1328 domain-containing protein [Paenibacillus mucilaginosus]